jgi:hypothetical protein
MQQIFLDGRKSIYLKEKKAISDMTKGVCLSNVCGSDRDPDNITDV